MTGAAGRDFPLGTLAVNVSGAVILGLLTGLALGHDAALLAGGHTHLQWTRRIGDALYVNPGSVGISYDRHDDPLALRPLAEWALVTVENGAVGIEFRQVPYAVEDVPAAALGSGRPYADEWAAQWA